MKEIEARDIIHYLKEDGVIDSEHDSDALIHNLQTEGRFKFSR